MRSSLPRDLAAPCESEARMEKCGRRRLRPPRGPTDMSYTPFDADALIEAAAPLLRLKIAPEHREGIRQNLKTAAKMAALVEQVKLDDTAEPAPVFRA
jgi:hypothetical protein